MQEVSLSGSLREGVGKKDAKAIRNADRVPAVIYGTGEQTHFSVKHTELHKLVYTSEVFIINLDIDGTQKQSVIQDIQHHPVTDRIQHVDFIELQKDKKIKVDIPVNLTGRPIGVLNGGVLTRIFRKLTVYALPENLPDAVEVEISDLKIGQTIKVGELATGNMNILQPDNAVVCGVKMARGALDEEEEEEEVDLDAMTDEEREEYLAKKAEEEAAEGADGEKQEGGDDEKKEGGEQKEGGGDAGGDGGEKKDGSGNEGGGDGGE
jgi:large subunit ribosomal protein L25